MKNTVKIMGLLVLAVGPATAHAQAPIVSSGVGVRLTQNMNTFLESQLANYNLNFDRPNIATENVSCFSEIGINNLTASASINNVGLNWVGSDDGLSVAANVNSIILGGTLYGNSNGDILCPDFSLTINTIELDDVVVTMNVSPSADPQYQIFLNFNAPPQIAVNGATTVDIAGIPDELTSLITGQAFITNFLYAQVNSMLASEVPSLFQDAIFTGMFVGSAGNFQYGIGATSIAIDDNGANALFDTQLSWMGAPAACIPPNSPTPAFTTNGTPGLGEYGDVSDVEISVADAAVNEVLWAVWNSGNLCFDSQTHPLSEFTAVLSGLSPEAGSVLSYDISFPNPPTVTFTDAGMAVAIEGFHLEADAIGAGGTSKQLLLVDADLSMGLNLELDTHTNEIFATIDASNVNFSTLSSQILFSNSPHAADDVKNFLTGYVIPRFVGQVQNMPVSSSVLPVDGYYVLLSELHARTGHAVAGVTVMAANDPSIGHNPPHTFIDSDPGLLKDTSTTIQYHGVPDQAGTALMYSWNVDGTAWSSWSTTDTAPLSALTQGSHTFSVRSRDMWQNVDPNPPQITFSVAAPVDGSSPSMLQDLFGCDVTGTRTGEAGTAAALLGALVVAVLIARRRLAA